MMMMMSNRPMQMKLVAHRKIIAVYKIRQSRSNYVRKHISYDSELA